MSSLKRLCTMLLTVIPMLACSTASNTELPSTSPMVSSETPSTPRENPCVKDGVLCDNQEPVATGCETRDGKGSTVTASMQIVADGLVGELTIRKAKATVCSQIYWAHFQPTGANQSTYEVWLMIDSARSTVQRSAANPRLSAWSVGRYIPSQPLVEVKACVSPGQDPLARKDSCIGVMVT